MNKIKPDLVKRKMHKKKANKVGRNDPCPCGSGSKYKNCCLDNSLVFSEFPYSCRGQKRYIDSMTRRTLRQQAGFGCASCGCPVIEYHHIIPFSEVKSNIPEQMIALCPTCHKRADIGGPWSPEFIYELKQHPYNKNTTKDRFAIYSPEFLIKCGIMEFEGHGEVIKLQKQPVFKIDRGSDGIIHISSLFFDEYDRLISFIDDNEWGIYINKVWDIEYISARRLIVRSAPRNIVLELEITDKELNIKRCLFKYRGSYLKSEVLESGKTIFKAISSDGNTILGDRKTKKLIFSPGASITVN